MVTRQLSHDIAVQEDSRAKVGRRWRNLNTRAIVDGDASFDDTRPFDDDFTKRGGNELLAAAKSKSVWLIGDDETRRD